MRRSLQNPRLAKTHRCYTVAEAAELYGCHRNTIRLWMRQGLKPVELRPPFLIHGTALNAFHAEQRRQGKRPCQPGELYCLPCRKPQRPAGGIFTYKPVSATTGMVRATCPDCGRPMHQRVNRVRLAGFEALARITPHRDADD